MAAGTVTCIDVGSTKIITMVATVSVGDNKITSLHGVGIAPSRGIQKGIIQDLSGATVAIRDSIEKAEVGAQKVYLPFVGFSGKHISSTNPAVTVDPRDHRVTEDTMREAHERVQDVKFPEDRVRVSIVPRHYTLDGTVKGIKNPLDMHGYRLDFEAHIVSAGASYIQNLEYCLDKADVVCRLDHLVPSALACGEAVLEPEDKEGGVILADIGGGTTDIAVYKDGSIFHTSALPVGGVNITNDLAVGLSIPFSAAEELKMKCGLQFGSELEADIGELTGKYRVSAEEVVYIIRARVEELLRMIITKSPYKPTRLVLTGGTAKLLGVEEFARDIFGFSVRVGKPKDLPEGTEQLEDPAYAASIGLLLWGARMEEEMGRIPPGGLGYSLERLGTGLRSGWQRIVGLIPFELKRKGPMES